MPPPTDAELDILIRSRLSLLGIDLDQLDPVDPDPVTGSPSQAAVLTSLRGFLRNTVPVISAWLPAVPGAPTEADLPRLAQQLNPPAIYPSIVTAWTEDDA